MKRYLDRLWLVLGALGLFVALGGVAIAQKGKAQSADAPKLALEKTEHDFGKVKEGETPSYTFKIWNEGTSDLVIKNVSPACGCTATDFSKTIAPGEFGKITLSVNTVGMSGKTSRYADVISNDKKQADLKLWLHLDVEKATKN